MVKAARGLQVLYPVMVHLAHLVPALHRVAREIYPDISQLISDVKKMFIKVLLRVQKVKQDAPSLSLPPQPIMKCLSSGGLMMWKKDLRNVSIK
jgi:hypothetical protein